MLFNRSYMGKSKILSDDVVLEVIRLYTSGECCSMDIIGKKFGTSKRIISRVLSENNIDIIRTGTRNKITSVTNGTKYVESDEYTFIAKHKVTGKILNDYNNISGSLTRYIKSVSPDIVIPSKFLRNSHYLKTGSYWHEQYFDILKTPTPVAVGRVEFTNDIIDEIIDLYTIETTSIHKLSKIFNVGHNKISAILKDRGIQLNKRGAVKKYNNLDVYPPVDPDCVYRAVHKVSGVSFSDYKNTSGALTKYIENNDKVMPPKLESVKKTHLLNVGEHWYQKYFDILKFDKSDLKLKTCPYCNVDIDCSNSNIKYKKHLYSIHNIDVEKHVDVFKDDAIIFKSDIARIAKLKNKENWVTCKICGDNFGVANKYHLDKHNIGLAEYKHKYGCNMSSNYKAGITKTMKLNNESGKMISYTSKPEKEIRRFLDELGISYETNRRMLNGKEIDILNHDKKIGIEFNGCKWHTEWFGKKDMNYHLNKTIACNSNGYSLLHIFEDELQYSMDIVYHKLKYIFNKSDGLDKISGRKCIIKEISSTESSVFLNKYHIQGSGQGCVRLGCFYKNELVSVVLFKKINKNSNDYDLTRFATSYNYKYQGVASKMLSYFIKNYNPSSIISFADRRWTLDKDNNLYTKLGFKLVSTLKPDYKYYNEKVDRYRRFHKFGFRKQILSKKYGFDLSMTETEMVKAIGYDRIWDCGLFKYKLIIKKEGS